MEEFARRELSKTEYFEGQEIGKVIKLEVQVVSGRNIRFTFENNDGKRFTATVFDQPWTNIRRLSHINFALSEDM